MKRKPSPPSSSSKSSSAKSPAAKQSRTAPGPRSRAAASKPAVKKAKAAPIASPGTSKQNQLITLLRSAAGASMADMMALTGWQSHTVRGMLSGALRKRLGLNVQCQRVDGVHQYRIVEGVAA